MKTTTARTHTLNKIFLAVINIVAGLILLGALSWAVWFFVFFQNHEETNDAQVEQYVTPIISRVTGYIEKINFQENQFVHKGDTLLVIDNREYKAKLDMAQADYDNAISTLDVLKKGVATTKADVAVHKAKLEAANIAVWETHLEFQRYENLFKDDATSGQELEHKKAAYESAKAHQAEIERNIIEAQLNTAQAASKVPAENALIELKRAALTNAALYYSYTFITAPYDGWVGRKTLQEGQLIKEGQNMLSIVSKEKWITANFKETQLDAVIVGQKVTFRADATGNQEYNGVVESISPASGARFSLLPPDNATGNFVKIEQRIPVRIKLTDEEKTTASLRAGMNIVVVAGKKD